MENRCKLAERETSQRLLLYEREFDTKWLKKFKEINGMFSICLQLFVGIEVLAYP